ncbi:MAG TPA: PAS domain S-box protein [Bryobacteraceae bacterium]|nr:PAS domain S-box protein [Bryobacteraceae bacterium]
MCVHDLDGVLLIVNPAAAQSLGLRPEDGVGVNMRQFLAPSVRHLFDVYLDRIRTHGSDTGLMRLMARDGRERIWLYRNILYEEPGSPPRVLGHAQDVTERVQAEEDLKESERRFHSLADTAPAFIWMTDIEGRCVFVNKGWLDFAGRTLEEDLGDGWIESLHPEDRKEAVATSHEAIARRERYQSEYRVRRADGEYRWILDSGAPRLDSQGHFLGFIGSCVDVTEARRDREALRTARDELALRVAERTADLVRINEALRQSEQHYQVLADLAPVGIFRTDDQGHCLYVNERICEIAGMSAPEFCEGRWDKILSAEDRARLGAEWQKAITGGGPAAIEHRIVRTDGSIVWALIHIAAERNAAGQVTGCIGTLADITERKRAEEENRRLELQVQQAQRLQSLGILAGGLAHDFNNLLTIIMGNARIALLDLPPGAPAVQYLAEIETATSRAAELTNQMLAYSGKGRFTVERVNLSSVTEETVKLLRTMLSAKTSLRLDLDSSLPEIDADPAQIRQIVMNLVTNAAEAIGESAGAIRISTGVVEAGRDDLAATYCDDQLPTGRYVFLEVRDTGCGMSPETQAHIFDPFFTTKFTGRGLGLAAALGIVRAHRGTLTVSSKAGQGSTFRMLFPVAERAAETSAAEPTSRPAAPGRGTILVVDDEAGMRSLARAVLEKSGFTVITANDGADAVRVFKRQSGEIRAVILDLTMPVMSGEEAAAELRRVREDVPIILSSGYSAQALAGKRDDKGITGFLKKPYDPATLTATIESVLQEKELREARSA